MKPGRELDALIAEKVMGLIVFRDETGIGYPADTCSHPDSRDGKLVPEYSTRIDHTWEVVEKIGDLGWSIGISIDSKHPHTKVLCQMKPRDQNYTEVIVDAATAPHAICLAALKAIGA